MRKGRTRPETGRRGLLLFRDDKSAGIVGYARFLLSVLLSWAPQGIQGEARRHVAPWVLSPPRRGRNKEHKQPLLTPNRQKVVGIPQIVIADLIFMMCGSLFVLKTLIINFNL